MLSRCSITELSAYNTEAHVRFELTRSGLTDQCSTTELMSLVLGSQMGLEPTTTVSNDDNLPPFGLNRQVVGEEFLRALPLSY